MSEKKEKKKLSTSAIVLIVGLIIILVPCLVFGGILLKSYLETGTPRNGTRFVNDLQNEISEEDVAYLNETLSKSSDVENVEVSVGQGQLKVLIDVKDNLDLERTTEVATNAYEKITSKLPVNKYFTTSTSKMYDLQIHVYTKIEASEIGSDTRQYILLHKNGAEEEYGIDDLAHPKNEEIAKELEGITDETPSDEQGENSDTE